MVDLKKFCGTDAWRPYLHEPFSRGEYTYATNGHIMVRVPRVAGIGEIPLIKNPEKIFAPMPADGWRTLRVALPPVDPSKECSYCYGSGFLDDDEGDCGLDCIECNGTGFVVANVSTEIGGVIFDLKYIRMVAELPDIEIVIGPIDGQSFFRFSGGDGALMPMRSEFENHVKVEVE